MGLKEVLLAKKALVEAEVTEFDSMVESLAVELKASVDGVQPKIDAAFLAKYKKS